MSPTPNRPRVCARLRILAATALAATAPTLACAAPLTVVVWDLRFSGGSVRVDVCTRETFLHGSCPYTGAAPAQAGETRVVIPDVPPGTYAIQAFHDFNDNDKVDRTRLGIPQEGVAFSRDAPLGLHGPSFERAAVVQAETAQTLRLRLRHFSSVPPGPLMGRN